MYLLMSSGIVLDDALKETSDVLNNAYLKDRLNKIINSVKEGSDFSQRKKFIFSTPRELACSSIFLQVCGREIPTSKLTGYKSQA